MSTTPFAHSAGASTEFLRPRVPRTRRRRRPLRGLWWSLRVGVLIGAPVGAVYWMQETGKFALREVVAAEGDRVSADWIESALHDQIGKNLVTLRLETVRQRLEEHPWTDHVVIDKRLPDRLQVRVEEREAVGVLEDEDELFFIDVEGRRIVPVAAGDDLTGLVRLAGGGKGRVSPAFTLHEAYCLRKAIELGRALGAADLAMWRTRLLRIEVVGDDDFRLYTETLPFPVLVRSADVVTRARRFERLLPEILGRVEEVGEVDLRFDGRVVVRPASAGSWNQRKET